MNEAAKMAAELYRDAISVPFMAKFVVFAKRPDLHEARLRLFCMTDDKMEKTLENQEHFQEIARSRDVEVSAIGLFLVCTSVYAYIPNDKCLANPELVDTKIVSLHQDPRYCHKIYTTVIQT